MFNRSLFSSCSEHWATPTALYVSLNKEFDFNDDPCPLNGNGGLTRPWGTSTYCNPPYGKGLYAWIKKGIEESRMGKNIVFLLPSRTDTKWFHELILPIAIEIRFLRGRLRFGNAKNSAPFPSMVVIFSQRT